jgi:hypothetical protein
VERSAVQRSFRGNVFRQRNHGPAAPPKVMKNGSCSATTVPGSTALPLSSLPESPWTCGPPKKMKMARTNIEWVAQVSLLRPGCSGRTDFSGETQVSKARPGPPTQSLEVAACFSTERGAGDLQSSRIAAPTGAVPGPASSCPASPRHPENSLIRHLCVVRQGTTVP